MKNITRLALLVVLVTFASTGFGQSTAPVHPINFSTRCGIGSLSEGYQVIAGFVVQAGPNYKSGDKMTVLVRVDGPGLEQFLGPNVVDVDPMVQVYNQTDTSKPIAENNGWDGSAATIATMASVGAFPLTVGSKDSVVVLQLAPGAYTAVASTATDGPFGVFADGVALIEVYDVSNAPDHCRFCNVSTRTEAVYDPSGDEDVIVGFVLSGTGQTEMLLRGVGNSLYTFGINDYLGQQTITLYDGQNAVMSDHWWTDGGPSVVAALKAAFTAAGAFQLVDGSSDSAMLATLPAGPYTVVCTPKTGYSGQVLMEAYVVPGTQTEAHVVPKTQTD